MDFFNDIIEICNPLKYNLNRNEFRNYYSNFQNIIAIFGFLKIIDSTLTYSKQFNKTNNDKIQFKSNKQRKNFSKFLKIYSKNNKEYIKKNHSEELKKFKEFYKPLYKDYQFNDGEVIGFFNFSNINIKTLIEDEENFEDNLNDYLLSFSPNVYKILHYFHIREIFSMLNEYDILFIHFHKLSKVIFNYEDCYIREVLIKNYEEFLSEIYKTDYFKKNHPTLPPQLNQLLLKLLFANEDLNKKSIKIYNPTYINGFSFFNSKKCIQKVSPKCKINFYGQEQDSLLYVLSLSNALINDENLDNFIKPDNFKIQFPPIGPNGQIISGTHKEGSKLVEDYNDEIFAINGENKFDYILYDLYNMYEINPLEIRKVLANLMHCLKDDSKFIFTVRPFFDFNYIIQTFINNDTLETIISVPINFNTYNIIYIVILNNNKPEDRKNKLQLIDLNYSQPPTTYNGLTDNEIEKILLKYQDFSSSKNSVILNNNELDFDEFDFTQEFYLKRGETFGQKDVNIKQLGEIADLIEYNPLYLDNEDLLIYTTKENHEHEKKVFESLDIQNPNDKEYLICKVKTKEVSPAYLRIYLNSDHGLHNFNLLSTDFRSNFIPPILNLMKIPIPDLKVQKEIIAANSEISTFMDELGLLKNQFHKDLLNYKSILKSIQAFQGNTQFSEKDGNIQMDPKWQYVFEGLIWPLSISYLKVTRGSLDKKVIFEDYLKLFEFINKLNVIVLLSAIPIGLYPSFKKTIFPLAYKCYHMMPWGGWISLYQNLKEVYDNNNFDVPFGIDFYRQLCSEKNIRLIEEAKDIRNTISAHGGDIDEDCAEKYLEKLKPKLNTLFNSMLIYKDLEMYYIKGQLEQDVEKNQYEHSVLNLTGPFSQPYEDTHYFDDILKSGKLYLFKPTTNELLQLKDEFAKFIQINKNPSVWVFYIFNDAKLINDEQKSVPFRKRQYDTSYVSFQQSVPKYIEQITDFKRTFID